MKNFILLLQEYSVILIFPLQLFIYPDPVTSSIIERSSNSMLVDFGKETFGKVIVENAKGSGKLKLYYGETRQEAQAETLAETFDYIDVNRITAANDTTAARAFRFIYLVCDQSVTAEKISALYEYLRLRRGDILNVPTVC